MKYKVNMSIGYGTEYLEIELDDNLTDEEVEQELKEYVLGIFEWGYERIDKE